MNEEKLEEILAKKVISWEEYGLLDDYYGGFELKTKQFSCPGCESEYTIAVRIILDGQYPDSTNTRIYVINEKKS